MSDYSKSIVYKLGCNDTTVLKFYIGSTHDEIQREQKHKSTCNNENHHGYNYKVYEFIRANGGWDNWKFEVIEHYPCDNKIQLKIREQYYYDKLNPELNTYRPFVSEEKIKEYRKISTEKYREEHKEEILISTAKYREEHKEEILISKAKYRENHKEEILKYREEHKDYHKNYSAKHYQDNKEEILSRHSKYIQEHKEKINEYIAKYREDNKDTINHKNVCECGGRYTSKHISTHYKSKKHIAFINSKL